ncbi:Dipeptidyl aminopeptidase 4, partial [termite gut metagenome]
MKKVVVNIVLFFCLFCFISAVYAGNSLDLKEIVSGKFRPEYISDIVPTSDGNYYTRMNAEGTQIIKYSFKTGEQVEVIFDTQQAKECPFKTFDGYTLSPDDTKILIRTETAKIYRRSYSAVYYIYTIRRNLVESLSNEGAQQAPVFSPDGNMIAFVRNNNIFLVKMLFNNSESQVTEDGIPNEIRNGIPDWVYEEEFDISRALEFSPDSKMLAYIRFDESEVPSFSLQFFAGQSGTYTYKYPKAGETASKVSVHTFDIKTTVT